MEFNSSLEEYVRDVFSKAWSTGDGQKVPESDDITMGNEAVLLDGTVLYADLDGSTNLVDQYKPSFAAEIYKTYLYCAAKIIKQFGGIITAYDGDRIMAVYIGNYKNTSAAKTALKINYAISEIINPAIKTQYNKTEYFIKQIVGIDTSKLFVTRTGIRGSNDLVWVGRAANYAAKLTTLSSAFSTYITDAVFKKISNEAKYSDDTNEKVLMWNKDTWNDMNDMIIYHSNWYWKI